jgi:hypothetical protein
MSNYVIRRSTSPALRLTALGVAASFALPILSGCGGNPPAPAEAPRSSQLPPPVGAPRARQGGMTTKQKLVLLAGAAALYYMYKRHQNAQGQQVQYYQSKTNGRIYYRDPKTHQAIWVTEAPQIQVPASEAQDYSNYQGYNNQSTGQEFGGYRDGGFYQPIPQQ